MHILKAASLYFIVVFAVGFVLGPIRVLWLVPRLGERAAELIEAPFMLLTILLAARWAVRHLASSGSGTRLAAGTLALALVLVAEFSIVLVVRRVTIVEYFAGRDPVSGVVYLLMLLVFAVMPMFVGATAPRTDRKHG
jgi:MFS family permease